MTNFRRAYEWLLFAPTRWTTMVFLGIAGALPVLLAPLDRTFHDVTFNGRQDWPPSCPIGTDPLVFKGLESRLNWWIFVLCLPLSLVLLRSAVRFFIGSVSDSQLPLSSLVAESQRALVGARLRRVLLSSLLPAAIGVIVLTVAYFDLGNVIPAYTHRVCPDERDWTVFVLIPSHAGTAMVNALHVACSYAVQYITGFFALLAFGLALIHNILYLRLIYQRRFAGEPAELIVLELDDPVCCFGQKALVPAFRLQVWYVVIVGIAVSVSRYFNVAASTTETFWRDVRKAFSAGHGTIDTIVSVWEVIAKITPAELFHDAGQGWLTGLFVTVFVVVGLPSLIKFLPFGRKGMLMGGDIGLYLAEFIPPGQGAEPSEMEYEDLHKLAGEFARNSFWPASDNVAKRLFAFAFAVLIFVILPVPLAPLSLVVVYAILVAGLSVVMTAATFLFYRYVLAYIGEPLVTPLKDP